MMMDLKWIWQMKHTVPSDIGPEEKTVITRLIKSFNWWTVRNAYLRSSSRKKSVKTWLFSSRSSWLERQIKSSSLMERLFWKWEAPGTRDREAILRWAIHKTCDWPSQQELATFYFDVIFHFFRLFANYLVGVFKQKLDMFLFRYRQPSGDPGIGLV